MLLFNINLGSSNKNIKIENKSNLIKNINLTSNKCNVFLKTKDNVTRVDIKITINI